MGILPEFIFQRIVARGIAAARRDTAFIEQLFQGVPIQTVDRIKGLVQKPINITMQAPRANTVLPCVAIILGADDEEAPVLGDVLGSGTPPLDIFSYNDDEVTEDPTLASIDPGFEGQPTRTFKDTDLVDRTGGGFGAVYQFMIRSTNYYITTFLYQVVKGVIVKNRVLLENNGIQNMVLTGSDVSVNTDLLPDHLYDRVLTAKILYFFDFYAKVPVISNIDLTVLEPDLGPCSTDDPSVVLSEITVTTDEEVTED